MYPEEAVQRILVVDDDDGMREMLRTLLGRAGYEVHDAATGEDALALAVVPDAALLDVRLPGVSGYEICRDLRRRFGDDLPIIFVSGTRSDPLDRVAGLLIGADDYLVKPFEPDELLARLRRLLRPRVDPDSVAPAGLGLTDREREVLELLAEGQTQREIARELVISDKTVATHIQRILEKLGVHTRAQAVAFAYRSGLVGSTQGHALVT